MKILAILLFSLLSIAWYYFSWDFLRMQYSDISQYNKNIITAILLAGTFLFGFLLSKLIYREKELIKKENNENIEEKDFFLPEIKEINSEEDFNKYESDKEVTKESIDIILDEKEELNKHHINLKEEQIKNDLEEILEYKEKVVDKKNIDIVDKTLLNVANNLKKSKKQDLKIIEGIGPKLEILLNNNGIYSYKDLKNTEINKLKNILKTGGKRYLKLHNPSTWPKQAILADSGKFEELKEYQEKLVKGIEK